jgi:hypothetical protein
MSTLDCQPVIILGAARSGTNMLRDMLTTLPGVATWPCDEINYLWRHGNASVPHDEFTVAQARPAVRRAVRRRFATMARRTGGRWLVEKTCANTLRVGFVAACVPEARYLVLVRDGRDVVPSAMQRWTAPPEPGYLARKARFVPVTDLPRYALRYLGHHLRRLTSADRRLPTWGPRCVELDDWVARLPLDEVCAAQWARCVNATADAVADLPAGHVLSLRYERFVAEPTEHLRRICEFLDLPVAAAALDRAAVAASPRSVGGWRRLLTPGQIARLDPWLEPTLRRCGYLDTPARQAA